jgi:hypothetical protein
MRRLSRLIPLWLGLLALPASAAVSTNPPPLQIVTLRKGVDMEALIQENNLKPKFRYRALNGFAAPMPEAVIQKLKADPRVLFVEADAPVKLCGRIDTLTNSQVNGFGAVRMGFDRFPMAQYNGRTNEIDVVVAVLDSGIDPHEDLPPSYEWFSRSAIMETMNSTTELRSPVLSLPSIMRTAS